MNLPVRYLEHAQVERLISQETGVEWFKQRMRILRCNPAFSAAAADYARSMVDLYKGRYLINRAIANVARQTICTAILSLYFEQTEKTGPFLSSIQNLTTEMNLCSRNTTAANVVLLERVGLVTRSENSKDRRWRSIRPTEQLIKEVESFLRANLTVADALFPARKYRELIDANDDVLERCFANSIHSLLITDSFARDLPGSLIFDTSDGGKILLLKLMSLKDTGQSSVEDTVEFPFEEVGSLFGLSRTHVRRLMKKAEAGGFVRLLEDGGRRVQILPPLEAFFENIVALNVARAQFDLHLANGDYDLLPIDPFRVQ
ncbi:helix-turn-helix domain-containing protein [Mesorhizobium sp. CCNWLW179-1]